MNKKGNLAKFQGVVYALLVLGILVGAAMLATTSFRDSVACPSDYTYNATAINCYETANSSNTQGVTADYNATDNWVTAQTNLSSKAPTAGTLFGIGLIIVAVFGGILYFMGRSGGGY